jgi:uncharacterized OB-fold protein
MEHKLTFKDYNAALMQNRLIGLKCGGCGAVTIQPRLTCRDCGSPNMGVIDLNGTGIIQSFTVVNVAPEGRQTEAPYIVVLVELNEGPWIMGNLCGIAPADATMDVMEKRVTMQQSLTFGDKYSGGEAARPVFAIIVS